jgi:hypothetical protein
MKKLISFAITLLSFSIALSYPKVTYYNLQVKFNKLLGLLEVNAELNFERNECTDSFKILLSQKCKIQSIQSVYSSEYYNVKFNHNNSDTLTIFLDIQMTQNSDFILDFKYDYPLGEDAVILDRGYRWYPLIGDNVAPFKMEIHVPSSFIATTGGNLLEEKEESGYKKMIFESSQAVFKLPLIIAPDNYYNIKEYDCGNIKTYFYKISEDKSESYDSINIDICSLLNYFNNAIGEYPFKRFSLIETSSFPGANIGSSFITVGKENIEAYGKGYKEWLYMTTAAQWIGAGVFPKLFCKGFWFLNISFPHYLRLMYIHDIMGENAVKEELRNLRDKYMKVEGTENDIPVLEIDYPNTSEKGVLVYAKGVLIIDKIKDELGDAKWAIFLKNFYAEFKGKTIILDDLLNSINKFDETGNISKSLMKMLSEKGMSEE